MGDGGHSQHLKERVGNVRLRRQSHAIPYRKRSEFSEHFIHEQGDEMKIFTYKGTVLQHRNIYRLMLGDN